MTQTILVGGAKYRPTGRGFVTQHTPMDEQYRFFASSHLYLGVEMGAGLIIMGVYTTAKQYFGRTWSLWLASLSFLASPFWFNPLTFDWNMVTADYVKYISWMRRRSANTWADIQLGLEGCDGGTLLIILESSDKMKFGFMSSARHQLGFSFVTGFSCTRSGFRSVAGR